MDSNSAARPRHRGSMTFLTPEEMISLLKAAREHSIRAWAMILLAYRHGMRASEVCSLRLAEADLKAGSIVIRRLKGSMQTTQPLFPHRQPLLDEIVALRAWLRTRPADGSDSLFVSQKGGRLDRTAFFRLFQAIAAVAGLPTEKRQKALGHRSINSTMQYVGTSDSQAAGETSRALMALY